MTKTILITGATSGIGLETAKMLRADGVNLLLHGRTDAKLEKAKQEISAVKGSGKIETYAADMSRLDEVVALAEAVISKHKTLDVLINNAGVFGASNPILENGQDIRFVVNTVAPYLLTLKLLPLLKVGSRVVNLSSAAQAPVDLKALSGGLKLSDNAAYSQSKLALTMWSAHLGQELDTNGPAIIAVNPASMLGSKMVKAAYGVKGGDLSIGADILTRAALSSEFADASGKYFDNDRGAFASPHPDALNANKNAQVTSVLDRMLRDY